MTNFDLNKPIWFWLTLLGLLGITLYMWFITIHGLLSNSIEFIGKHHISVQYSAEHPLKYYLVVAWDSLISVTLTIALIVLVKTKSIGKP